MTNTSPAGHPSNGLQKRKRKKVWKVYRYQNNRHTKCNIFCRSLTMMDDSGVLVHFRDLDFLNIGKGTNGLLGSKLAGGKPSDRFFSLVTLRGDFDFEARSNEERIEIIMEILKQSGFRKMKWLPQKLTGIGPNQQYRLTFSPDKLGFGPLNQLNVVDMLADVE